MIKIPVVPLILALFLLSLPLSAQDGAWTAVASTGAIDEASLADYQTNGSLLQHAAGSLVPVVARYNVTNIFASFTDDPPWDTLELGYFDNAAGSAVSAVLYSAQEWTGNRTTLCSVTSVDSAVATRATCNFTAQIDFDNFLYFVEVTVTRNASTLTPSARTLRLYNN